MMDHRRVSTAADLARVWVHETRRVFADRLISYEDKGWFEDLAKKQGEEHLALDWDETIGAPGTKRSFLMYADFLIPGAEPKVICGGDVVHGGINVQRGVRDVGVEMG